MPAMNAAIAALDTLKQGDISEVKSMTHPPQLVKVVLEAVCILKVVGHLGALQRKKIPKIQIKLGWSSPHTPTPIQTFFWKPIADMDRTLKS